MKKIIFKDNTEIVIRKFTREYAANQNNRMYLNVTLTRESDSFNKLVAAATPENVSSFRIDETDDDTGETITTSFEGFVLENIIEIHEVYSNDLTMRAYMTIS